MIFRICIISFLIWVIPGRTFSQFKLTKVEEFKIESLSEIDLLDYYPSGKLYLGFKKTSKENDIVLVDPKGEILVVKDLLGDSPNQSVGHINSMAFSMSGDIWLQSATHVLLYNQNLVLKERLKYTSTLSIQIKGRKEYFPYFYKDGSKNGLSFITNPSGTNSFTNNTQLDQKLIEIYALEKNNLFKIAPASDRAMYSRFSKSLLSSLYFIVYKIDNNRNKLFLTTRLDNEILVYNLNTHQLESRLKINHGEFKVLKLNQISLTDLPSVDRISLGAKNHQLFLLGEGLVILDYVKEIPEGIYEQKKKVNSQYHHYDDPAYHRLILFDQSKQISGDIPLPENGHLMLSMPGNKLLFKIIDPEVEEDFIRYEIHQLVKN